MSPDKKSDHPQRRLLILGAGYVGQALAEEALKQGIGVSALTRNPSRAATLRSLGVGTVVEADLASLDWHDAFAGDFDFVVNCVSSAGGGIAGYRHSYLEGQSSLVQWLRKRRVSLAIYTSSTSVYPQVHGELVNEEAATGGNSETARVLLESEQLFLEASPDQGTRIIFRLAGIYGPGRHYLLDQLRSGQTVFPGSGDFILNLIHRDDIVRALMAVFMKPQSWRSGCYNLSDGCHQTKATIVRWLAKAIGVEGIRFDAAQATPRSRRRQNAEGLVPNRCIDNGRFRNQFSWEPRYPSYKEGYLSIFAKD